MLLATGAFWRFAGLNWNPGWIGVLPGFFLLDLLSTDEMIYSIRLPVNVIEYIFSRKMEMAKKKSSVGGKRDGAGRKIAHPEGATIPLVASVPAVLVDRLMAVAALKEWNRSEAVTEAVRLLLKKHEPKIPSQE